MKNMPCAFCQNCMEGEYEYSPQKRIIIQTEAFSIFPTLGSFINNYLLIVPKRHINCFGELTNDEYDELAKIVSWQKEVNIEYFDSKTSIFEHGALLPRNDSGKSVTHAHLHVFPCNESFVNELKKYNLKIHSISNISDLSLLCKEYESYIYYNEMMQSEVVFEHSGLPSQFMRKLLADRLGISTWNWREYPMLDKAEECVNFYKQNPKIIESIVKG